MGELGHHVAPHFQVLDADVGAHVRETGNIAVGPRQTFDKAAANWIARIYGDDRYWVTDYNMPGISGLEVAKALKEIRADLPVVLASGYITAELRAEAPAAGVRELIHKPNTVDDLCEAVARWAQSTGDEPRPS